jgi:hypothetical protein
MTDLAELELVAKKANQALGRAQEKRANELNKALIGKCFRYRNSYSCPEKPSDYFWFYVRVLSANGYGVTCHTFQTDKNGRIEIEWSSHRSSYHGGLSDGYRPITRAQFDKAWRAVKKCIASF